MDKDCNGITLRVGDIVEPVDLCYKGMYYHVVEFRDEGIKTRNVRTGNWGYKHVACRVRKLRIEELI